MVVAITVCGFAREREVSDETPAKVLTPSMLDLSDSRPITIAWVFTKELRDVLRGPGCPVASQLEIRDEDTQLDLA
jgi:hypothetical protein